jgi:hypothetical protein
VSASGASIAPAPRPASDAPPRSGAPGRSGPTDVRHATWFIFAFLFVFIAFIFLALIPPDALLRDADIYWHVATGRWIWDRGAFPQVDEFSHTSHGQVWIAKEWLSQMVFFGAYRLAGWRGVVVVTACAIALAYALLFLALSRTMRLTVAIGIAAVALALSFPHFIARPQIFVDAILVAWTAAMVRAVEERRAPNLLLLLLMVLWANLHASFTAGLAIAAAFAVEALLDFAPGEGWRVARRWGLFLLGAIGAAFVTPYGYRPLFFTGQIFGANEALQYIQEWQPTSMRNAPVALIAMLLLFFFAILSGIRIRAWRLILIVALTYFMLSAIRFSAMFFIVLPLLLASSLTAQFPFLRLSKHIDDDPRFYQTMARIGRRALVPIYLAGVVVVVVGMLGRPITPVQNITPVGAVNAIYARNLKGNIYNSYNFGGYLIFRNLQTFIDGRAGQLFLNGFITRLNDIIGKRPRQFVPYLDEFNVTLAVVAPNSIEAQELEASPAWEIVYDDSVADLFRKRE